jgi:nitroimidazol reductase NimA-like FMN-containing flavoprotein (pyridoxamine 5'-phosphate oxidase superfamily)
VIAMSPGGRPPETLDPGGLDDIAPDECWRLLATQHVGRLAVIVGHYPLIFPVNYTLDEKEIVFRTAPGTKLHAIERSNVTFEVDEVDVVHRAGWSVLVRGVAHEFLAKRNTELAARYQEAGADPWAPGERDRIVRVVPDHVTGRRIRPGELPNAVDPRSYV